MRKSLIFTSWVKTMGFGFLTHLLRVELEGGIDILARVQESRVHANTPRFRVHKQHFCLVWKGLSWVQFRRSFFQHLSHYQNDFLHCNCSTTQHNRSCAWHQEQDPLCSDRELEASAFCWNSRFSIATISSGEFWRVWWYFLAGSHLAFYAHCQGNIHCYSFTKSSQVGFYERVAAYFCLVTSVLLLREVWFGL